MFGNYYIFIQPIYCQKNMDKEPIVTNNKSCKAYFLVEGVKIYFTGDFDSGNLERVQQLASYTYRITPGYDKVRQSTHKTFFHFKTSGFKHCTVKFIVTRAYLLEHFINSSDETNFYRPVVRRHNHSPFQKINQDVKIYYNSSDEPQLSFSFAFQQENWVEFAFAYPYSYEDSQALISQLSALYRNHKEIYFHDQILCKTSQTRKVQLITITDKRNLSKERQSKIEGLFELEAQRPFKIDKPKVIISGRVHPGESPASFCMQGILRFLLNQRDYRSYLLRKNFVFVLIPMLNPEGVYEGMFRYDLNGENLNRMYKFCDSKKHVSIWSIKKYLQSLDRVDFFFDLHAHPSKKGFFIYGNAFDQFLQQTQAQIFSKMIEYNCPYFENLDCIYSEKAMNAKDKYDNYSKQGCARVYYHSLFKMIHSYTVQCGYFWPTKLNRYPPQRQFTIPGSQYVCTFDWQNFTTKEYTPESYMMLGKSILISIIDLFHINPYTRISTSDFKSINNLRKFTAQRIYNEVERFRLIDSNCYRKIRQIATLIQQNYYIPRFKLHGLTVSQNYGMKYRKKSFNLNSMLYLRNKSSQKQKQIIRAESSLTKHEEQIVIPIKSMSSKQFIVQSTQTLSNNQPSRQLQHKLKIFQASKLLQRVRQDQNIDHQPIFGKIRSNSLSGYGLSQSASKFKKMQDEIINQLLKSKLKPEIKNEGQKQIDRIGSFLRKQGKSVKLPLIHNPDSKILHK